MKGVERAAGSWAGVFEFEQSRLKMRNSRNALALEHEPLGEDLARQDLASEQRLLSEEAERGHANAMVQVSLNGHGCRLSTPSQLRKARNEITPPIRTHGRHDWGIVAKQLADSMNRILSVDERYGMLGDGFRGSTSP